MAGISHTRHFLLLAGDLLRKDLMDGKFAAHQGLDSSIANGRAIGIHSEASCLTRTGRYRSAWGIPSIDASIKFRIFASNHSSPPLYAYI